MPPFKNPDILQSVQEKSSEDLTFGIEGVWISAADPKGTVRVGNIKIDEFYDAEDLMRLRDSVDNNFGEEGKEMSKAIAEYRGYVSIIEKLLKARTEQKEEKERQGK